MRITPEQLRRRAWQAFLAGMASIVFPRAITELPRVHFTTDYEALRSDWQAAANDFGKSFEKESARITKD